MRAEKEKATLSRVAAGSNRASRINGGDANIRKILSFTESRVLNFLNQGGRYSAADISIGLHLSDPRSVIKRLRDVGIPIADEWCKCTQSNGRYKKYFIGKTL